MTEHTAKRSTITGAPDTGTVTTALSAFSPRCPGDTPLLQLIDARGWYGKPRPDANLDAIPVPVELTADDKPHYVTSYRALVRSLALPGDPEPVPTPDDLIAQATKLIPLAAPGRLKGAARKAWLSLHMPKPGATASEVVNACGKMLVEIGHQLCAEAAALD